MQSIQYLLPNFKSNEKNAFLKFQQKSHFLTGPGASSSIPAPVTVTNLP